MLTASVPNGNAPPDPGDDGAVEQEAGDAPAPPSSAEADQQCGAHRGDPRPADEVGGDRDGEEAGGEARRA